MKKLNYLLILAVLCLPLVTSSGQQRTYSQIVTVNDYTYEIEVEGTLDPINETIIIENLGDAPLVNPRITVNGLYDWFDTETIAREVTRGCTTDEEKAILKEQLMEMAAREEIKEAERWAKLELDPLLASIPNRAAPSPRLLELQHKIYKAEMQARKKVEEVREPDPNDLADDMLKEIKMGVIAWPSH